MKSIKLAILLIVFNCVSKDAPTVILVNDTDKDVIFGINTNLETCIMRTNIIHPKGSAFLDLERPHKRNILINPESILTQCPNNCPTCGLNTRITCVFAQDLNGTVLASSAYQYQGPEMPGFGFEADKQIAQIGLCPIPMGQTTPNLTDKYSGVDSVRIVLSPYGSSIGVSSVPATPASLQPSLLNQGGKFIYGSQTYFLTSTSI